MVFNDLDKGVVDIMRHPLCIPDYSEQPASQRLGIPADVQVSSLAEMRPHVHSVTLDEVLDVFLLRLFQVSINWSCMRTLSREKATWSWDKKPSST